MEITIRPMELSDVPEVARLDEAAFVADAWRQESFRREVTENRLARYFVLEDAAGVLLGSLGCWAVVDEVHIVTIAVHPSARRRGLGEVLLQQSFTVAEEMGVDTVTLECRESNAAALALYAKYGFARAGRRRAYYKDGEDALILTASEIARPVQRQIRRELRDELQARGLRITDRASQ